MADENPMYTITRTGKATILNSDSGGRPMAVVEDVDDFHADGNRVQPEHPEKKRKISAIILEHIWKIVSAVLIAALIAWLGL